MGMTKNNQKNDQIIKIRVISVWLPDSSNTTWIIRSFFENLRVCPVHPKKSPQDFPYKKKNVNKKGSYGCPTMSTYVYQPEMLQAKFPNPSNSSIPKRNLSILALDSTLVIQRKSQILQIKNADKNAGLWSSFNKNYWPYQQTLLQNPNCPPFAS